MDDQVSQVPVVVDLELEGETEVAGCVRGRERTRALMDVACLGFCTWISPVMGCGVLMSSVVCKKDRMQWGKSRLIYYRQVDKFNDLARCFPMNCRVSPEKLYLEHAHDWTCP